MIVTVSSEMAELLDQPVLARLSTSNPRDESATYGPGLVRLG